MLTSAAGGTRHPPFLSLSVTTGGERHPGSHRTATLMQFLQTKAEPWFRTEGEQRSPSETGVWKALLKKAILPVEPHAGFLGRLQPVLSSSSPRCLSLTSFVRAQR